ncbi:MAG: sensor histidine kinase [Agriterribacter sp.]
MFRTAQEHCTNIVKHAQPSKVEVDLVTDNYCCKFSIADDGVGMSASNTPSGIGMKNIGARMAVLNGQVQIFTSQGRGFRLETQFPLQQ